MPEIRVVIPAPEGASGVETSLRSITSQRGGGGAAFVVEGEAGANPHALIESGFARSGGDVLGWLPPGDTQLAWTLRAVAEIFNDFSDISWIASLRPITVDASFVCTSADVLPGFARDAFADGRLGAGDVDEATVFFRRSLWDRAGGRFPPLGSLADARGSDGLAALWARFFDDADLVGVDIPLAAALARPVDVANHLFPAARGPRAVRRALTRLALGRVPRVGPLVEGALGYSGRRLTRPDRGPESGRFHLERHAFS